VSEGELAHEAEQANERAGPRRDFQPGEMRGGSILGHPVKRVEDPRFLTGEVHRLMEDGKLPEGNVSVLVNAPTEGLKDL
jgi:hypothetical protein